MILNETLLRIVGVVMMLVLIAMIIDLLSGINKARQRNEVRTSQALRRTLTKFISYEGSLLIAAMVDILIEYSQFYALFHIDLLSSTPIICILVGIFLLVVEFISVRESADAKTKQRQADVLVSLSELLTKDDLKSLLKKVAEHGKEQNKGGEQ